ncbi:carbonic anhydrase-like [Saccostrea echinata]|uniref:carbonic anhydrase-like n=1 Tax=Saccostrea echinata TaxID=191078 RepID=UPI002A80C93F|nr:carbonic anhydrase-like [Saccostrea echinata]
MRKVVTHLSTAVRKFPLQHQCHFNKLKRSILETNQCIIVFSHCLHDNKNQRPPWNYDKLTNWGYGDKDGPDTWHQHFPDGAGYQQSPIDIVTSKAQFDPSLANTPLKFKYGVCHRATVDNTGRSLKININQPSELTGGPLRDTFHFEQFHLHWGSTNDKGSEHTIDGKCFAAEWHFVHWNLKYGNFLEAAYQPDGLAVVTYMVNVGAEHKEFKKLTDVCPKIEEAYTSVKLAQPFDPLKMLKNDVSQYWTYHGSLTTPPLLETVTWIIFRNHMEISQEQMDILRKLKFPEGQCMVDNCRPPGPIHQRTVRASFSES